MILTFLLAALALAYRLLKISNTRAKFAEEDARRAAEEEAARLEAEEEEEIRDGAVDVDVETLPEDSEDSTEAAE